MEVVIFYGFMVMVTMTVLCAASGGYREAIVIILTAFVLLAIAYTVTEILPDVKTAAESTSRYEISVLDKSSEEVLGNFLKALEIIEEESPNESIAPVQYKLSLYDKSVESTCNLIEDVDSSKIKCVLIGMILNTNGGAFDNVDVDLVRDEASDVPIYSISLDTIDGDESKIKISEKGICETIEIIEEGVHKYNTNQIDKYKDIVEKPMINNDESLQELIETILSVDNQK